MNKEQFDKIFMEHSFKTDEDGVPIIKEEWSIGGIGGGNCWSDGGHYAITGDTEPDSWALDEIIEDHFDKISFIQYKKLNRTCVKYNERTYREYYGNYSEYRYKTIRLDDFYGFMKEYGYVD